MSRRLDARYLAELIVSHQITEEDGFQIARDLVDRIPRSTFRLSG
jgi:glucuronate isomerase